MKRYQRGQSPSNKLFDAIQLLEQLEPTQPEARIIMKNVRHVLRGVLSALNEADMDTIVAETEPHPHCPGCRNEWVATQPLRKCCRAALSNGQPK